MPSWPCTGNCACWSCTRWCTWNRLRSELRQRFALKSHNVCALNLAVRKWLVKRCRWSVWWRWVVWCRGLRIKSTHCLNMSGIGKIQCRSMLRRMRGIRPFVYEEKIKRAVIIGELFRWFELQKTLSFCFCLYFVFCSCSINFKTNADKM